MTQLLFNFLPSSSSLTPAKLVVSNGDCSICLDRLLDSDKLPQHLHSPREKIPPRNKTYVRCSRCSLAACPICILQIMECWGSKCPQCHGRKPEYIVVSPDAVEGMKLQRIVRNRWLETYTFDLRSEVVEGIGIEISVISVLLPAARRIAFGGITGAAWGSLFAIPTLGLSLPIGFCIGACRSARALFI